MNQRDTRQGGSAAPAAPVGGDRRPSLSRILWEWSRSVLLAVLIFTTIRTMGLEAFKIPTGSMEGTLLVGDFLLVNKAVYGPTLPGTDIQLPGFRDPHRGDVVVFNPPHEPRKNYVKRLVGLPGDTLRMRGKTLLVNGVAQDEPYARHVDTRGDAVHPDMEWQESHLVASPVRYHPSRDTWGPIVVPEGSYFVLGDNRDNSEDSRYWGFVEREQIRGRPWLVYYSARLDRGDEERPLFQRIRWGRFGHVVR